MPYKRQADATAQHRSWIEVNRERNRENARVIRRSYIARGLCSNCGSRPARTGVLTCEHCFLRQKSWKEKRRKPKREPIGRAESTRRYRERNPDACAKAAALCAEKTKAIVFDHYGRVCKCCGETRVEFLTLDHIDGGGAAHRRELKAAKKGSSIYVWAKNNGLPDTLQTLCMNCNFSKGRRGYCPHEREMKKKRLEVTCATN